MCPIDQRVRVAGQTRDESLPLLISDWHSFEDQFDELRVWRGEED
jgi:hypothetical protein